MPFRPSSILLLVMLSQAGCGSSMPAPLPDNAYANQTESAVRTELGEPSREFQGHYGKPPADFTRQFTGEIMTLVFKKPGGEYYVSFEKRPAGWVSICSSWLPNGAEF